MRNGRKPTFPMNVSEFSFFGLGTSMLVGLFLRFVGFEFLVYKVPESFLAFSSVRIFLPIRRRG
jgi:hypothetical protein